MTLRSQSRNASWPPSLALAIERACNRFETAWRSATPTGRRPRVEDFVRDLPAADRSQCLPELVALDVDYRRRQGEQVTSQEYQSRFPEYAEAIGALFLLQSDDPTGKGPSAVNTPPCPPGAKPVEALGPTPGPGREAAAGTDRNLLFGIVALQMDFISRDALVAGMHAWVLDKAKPLGQILVAQNTLSPDERGVLEALVDKHLKRHGNNAEQSLAAVAAPAAVAQELRNLADGELRASLDSLAGTGSGPDPELTTGYQEKDSGPEADAMRYRVLRPHAKGGLGEVFVALDQELHREVALKEIQERFAEDPQSRNRFLLEAEITGGLEHPGIVPVYGLGRYADGRPFYAMRFIQGDSLKAAIQRFHDADQPERDPGERGLELRQLLRRFVDVCNAVAYAHSRGVLHRDLKPANVMLGKFGETIVVDWGLAKTVGRQSSMPASDEVTLRPQAGVGVAMTQIGSALGTPAFMSPEQAAGRLDLVGPASDVYSLGATLYSLLTGQAPFRDGDPAEVLDKVRRGAFAPPQVVKSSTPPALAAVCLKAMALEPEKRYPTPLDLAADVDHWLGDEPVGAWEEPWTARLGRWARRHKVAVSSALALLLTAVAGLAIGLVAVKQEKARTQEALAAEARRRQQAREALDVMSSAIIDEWLGKQRELLPAHKAFLEKALASYEEFAADTARDEESRAGVAKAFRRVGNIRSRLGQAREAEEAYRRSTDLFAHLAADFPGVADYAQDLAVTYLALGDLYRDHEGRAAEAQQVYQQALDLLGPMAAARPDVLDVHSAVAAGWNKLGVAYLNSGRITPAESALRKGLEIRLDLVGRRPDVASFQDALAESFESLGFLASLAGRVDPAEDEFKKAVAIHEQLVRDHPKDPEHQSTLAKSYNHLGHHYESIGLQAKALVPYQKGFDIWHRLAGDYPTRPEYQMELAAGYRYLGRAHFFSNRQAEADAHLQESVKLFERLNREFPEHVPIALHFADAIEQIGLVQRESGKGEQALNSLTRGVRLIQGVLQQEPNNSEARNRLVTLYMDRAEAFVRLGRQRDAEKDWDGMIERGEGQTIPHLRMYRAMALAHRGGHAQATAAVEDLLANGLEPENAMYNYACIFSLSSGAAAEDSRLSPAERQKLRDRYAARAVDLLLRSHKAGRLKFMTDSKYLRADTDLAPLRAREDFMRLIGELERAEKADPDGGRQ